MILSQAGKEEIALALILLKDFKTQGEFKVDVFLEIYKLAKFLGVWGEFEALSTRIPPLRIEPRYK